MPEKEPDLDPKIEQAKLEALHRDRSHMARLRRHFFAGLLVVTPLSLTLWIVSWLVNLVDGNARHFLSSVLDRFNLNYRFELFGHEYSAIPFGFGLIIVFVGLCFVGMVTSNFVGKSLLRILDRLLRLVPGVSWIYGAATQISHAFLSRDANVFEKVILLEYPRKGTYGVGFVTCSDLKDPKSSTGEGMQAVFIPTTPNPTSGFFLLVPTKEVIPCDLTVEEGMKMVISGGVITPDLFRRQMEVSSNIDGVTSILEPDRPL